MRKDLAEIAINFDTDKKLSQSYIQNFERHFGPLRHTPIKVLELGVLRGGSLLMWHEYFPNGVIVGLDINPGLADNIPERVHVYQGSQDDRTLLDRIAQECAPDGFDVVIDDASHVGILSRDSYRNLYTKHLKSGGIYVIEDWGTGYWDSWQDGRSYQVSPGNHEDVSNQAISILGLITGGLARIKNMLIPNRRADSTIDLNFTAHNFGMVGFVKELIDEVAWPDISFPGRGNNRLLPRQSTIREMSVYCGHVFIVKA